MKGYFISFVLFVIAISLFILIAVIYPKSPKLNDVQLYAVRLANTETIAQSHQEWSLEKQAVAVDKSMRKLKSNESWHSFFYGLGYFSVILLLLSGWTIAKSTRYAHKHRFGTLASLDWLNRRYGEQETY